MPNNQALLAGRPTDYILKDGNLVTDTWQFFPDEIVIQSTTNFLVSFNRWCAERESLSMPLLRPGVVVGNTDDVRELIPDLKRLELICIEFPDATDGRGYSQAHLLRHRYGFQNEIRATGDVQVDQLFLMVRCGFNAFALAEGIDPIQASRHLSPFSVSYQ